MARIIEFSKIPKDRYGDHTTVKCGFSVYDTEEGRLLQLDTYGSEDREIEGKTSQSIQLDERAAKRLVEIIVEAFPGLVLEPSDGAL